MPTTMLVAPNMTTRLTVREERRIPARAGRRSFAVMVVMCCERVSIGRAQAKMQNGICPRWAASTAGGARTSAIATAARRGLQLAAFRAARTRARVPWHEAFLPIVSGPGHS
jgi:hypothetical protein